MPLATFKIRWNPGLCHLFGVTGENSLQIKAFLQRTADAELCEQEHQSNRVNKICPVPKRATLLLR